MKMTYVNPEESVENDIVEVEGQSGVTATATSSSEEVSKSKSEANADRLAEGEAICAIIAEKEAERAAAIANYDTMINTTIANSTDITSLDMTSVLDPSTIDYLSKGLPNPADYDLDPFEICDLSGIDGSMWPLPKPELAKLDPGCFDLDDMYLSSLIDLDGMDMRGWDMPSFDFSWATDWDFPEWMDPSSINCRDLFDMSDIDLGGIIDLSSVSLPEWMSLDTFDMDWDIDLSGEFDSLKSIFDGMGSDGDLLGMGSLASVFQGIGCVTASIVDVLSPDSIVDVVSNFDLPDISDISDVVDDFIVDSGDALSGLISKIDIDGFDDFDLDSDIFDVLDFDMPKILESDTESAPPEAKGPVLAALGYLGTDWYWWDKAKRQYNYDMLVNFSPTLLWYIEDEPNYEEIVHLLVGLQAYDKGFNG